MRQAKDSLFLKNIPRFILCFLHKEMCYKGAKEWCEDPHTVNKIGWLMVPENNWCKPGSTAAKRKVEWDVQCWKWAIQAKQTRDFIKSALQGCYARAIWSLHIVTHHLYYQKAMMSVDSISLLCLFISFSLSPSSFLSLLSARQGKRKRKKDDLSVPLLHIQPL